MKNGENFFLIYRGGPPYYKYVRKQSSKFLYNLEMATQWLWTILNGISTLICLCACILCVLVLHCIVAVSL